MPRLDRRSFIGLCSTCAAFLTQAAHPQTLTKVPVKQSTVKNRKNFIALQVKPFSWVDEGVDQVLDNLQQKGNVNTIFAYTFDYEESRLKKDGAIPLPDHGPIMARSIPNLPEVSEIDVYGLRTTSPCFNHPDYRAFLTGKIESLLSGYSGQVDGLAWGCERQGPIQNMIGGGWTTKGISCFCRYCRAKARERDISVQRAMTGYRQLDQLFGAAAQDRRPADGYFVAFWRLLLEYPEILSWEKLWTDSYHEVRAEVYGTGKAISPEKPFGFHIMQNMTFSPFYRAEEDYSQTKDYSDFLKLATYNNSGGPRMAAYLDRLSATVFHDATPQDFLPFYYKVMNYQEAPYDQLHLSGLSADYVARETKRALAGVDGEVKIYPGIDIDVPTKLTDKRTKPDDVRAAIRAAHSAGANGVVLSTRYEEMWLANLSAAGETLRETFAT
jgi:hypothetical protein